MIKRLFAILTLAACLPFAGCEINVNQPRLERIGVTVSLRTDYDSVRILGGSGDYSARISDRSVADVYVEATFGAGTRLYIEPKSEGEAVVTVTDRRSSFTALCFLTVVSGEVTFKVSDIKFCIDADRPEEIEAALKADTYVPPIGGTITTGSGVGLDEWMFTDADGNKIGGGTFSERELTEANPIFTSLFGGTNAVPVQRWTLRDKYEGQCVLDMYILRPYSRVNVGFIQINFYEDLTERCRAAFPDAGVRGVARAFIVSQQRTSQGYGTDRWVAE